MAAAGPDDAVDIFSNAALACAGFQRWPEALAVYRELAGFSPPTRTMLGEPIAAGRPVPPLGPPLGHRPTNAPGAVPPMAMAYDARTFIDRHYAAAFFWPYVIRSLNRFTA